MRDVNIVGGGPAGLYAAILLKQVRPQAEIRVYERNRPDQTFGFGVVFSGRTLEVLAAADAISAQRIAERFVRWDDVVIAHRNQRIAIGGNRFHGIARIDLLHILQERCRELGVELLHGVEVGLEGLPAADLLLAADGVNSMTRTAQAAHYRPTLEARPNRYIWYGTKHPFDGLTLTFRQNAHGVFAAHSYRFDREMSTFIVECDPTTWEAAGLDRMSEPEGRAYVADVFARDLQGEPLISNDSRWIQFRLVACQNWVHGCTGLLGDAAHTAHFSIGSGTKLALEDAIAVAQAVAREDDIEAALLAYQAARKPVVDAYQVIAGRSMAWFERLRDVIHLEPIALAYSAMTRSGRLDWEDVRRRSPDFATAWETWRARESSGA